MQICALARSSKFQVNGSKCQRHTGSHEQISMIRRQAARANIRGAPRQLSSLPATCCGVTSLAQQRSHQQSKIKLEGVKVPQERR